MSIYVTHERTWVPVDRVLITQSRIFMHPLMMIQMTSKTFDEQLTRAIGWTMDRATSRMDSRIKMLEESLNSTNPWGDSGCRAKTKHLVLISPPSIEGIIETREDYLQCERQAKHEGDHVATHPRSGKPYAFRIEA